LAAAAKLGPGGQMPMPGKFAECELNG